MRERKRDCSYIDAGGHAAARQLGVPFLTGDPLFKGLANVDFVRYADQILAPRVRLSLTMDRGREG